MIGDREILNALRGVYDPCSIGADVPLSVVDMGLVLDWVCSGMSLQLRMCVTSPCCTMAPNIARAAEAALLHVPGVASVEVVFDSNSRWTPERMSSEARRRLADAREQSLKRGNLQPRQWKLSTSRRSAADIGEVMPMTTL